MRDFLKTTGRRVRVGWFWPFAVLALPMCTLDFDDVGPFPPDPAFFPGTPPVTSAVMCDIPQVVVEEGSDCATDADVAAGMSLAHAAVALNLGETNSIVLDFSPAATSACNGMPRKIAFHGTFPDGLTVCLNCAQQIPAVYPGPTDVCIAKCKDLINFGDGPLPAEGVDTFCAMNARPSTNFDKDACYEGFCTTGGMPIPTAADPRRDPEAVVWVDLIDTDADGNALSFSGDETGDFSAGAASEQLITEGDAWVEFEAGETGVSHIVGVRASCDTIAICPDTDGTLADIPLSLSLNRTGDVNVIENGVVVAGPFPPYSAGERFRIHVVEHFGTANISFSRLPAPCMPNTPCTEDSFYEHPVGTGPSYPLRVDATFRETNASLQNVTIMRIIR